MFVTKKTVFLLIISIFIVFSNFGDTDELDESDYILLSPESRTLLILGEGEEQEVQEEQESDFLVFIHDSSMLFSKEEEAKKQLDIMAKYLNGRDLIPGQITICGYRTVLDDYSERISRDRAFFVMNELQKRGVSEEFFSEPKDNIEDDENSNAFAWSVKILLDGNVLTLETVMLANAETEPLKEDIIADNKTESIKPFLTGKPGPYAVSFSPLFGMFYGQGEEILYKYRNSDQFASHLLWDLKPLFYIGMGVEFGPRDPFRSNGFFAAGSLKVGFPMKTGIMEDRDWNYKDNDELTHYSRHDSHTKNALLGDAKAGYSWKLRYNLALGAYGEISVMHYSWSAEDGYYQYLNTNVPDQVWTDDIPKEYLNGPVIQYSQLWMMIAPGISMKWRINELFSAEGFFGYTPLIYGTDMDDHLVPTFFYNHITQVYEQYEGVRFYGQFFGGHYINGGGKFSFLYNNMEFALSLSYRYITGLRGMSYFQDIYLMRSSNNPVIRNAYEGGMGYSTLEVGFSAKFYIYKN